MTHGLDVQAGRGRAPMRRCWPLPRDSARLSLLRSKKPVLSCARLMTQPCCCLCIQGGLDRWEACRVLEEVEHVRPHHRFPRPLEVVKAEDETRRVHERGGILLRNG